MKEIEMSAGSDINLLSAFRTTIWLIIITILVYFLMAVESNEFITLPAELLHKTGGNLALLSLSDENWRLLTNIFLHAGLLHLLLNMYMLLVIGIVAERTYGHIGMLCLYLTGGLWASYASAVWHGTTLVHTGIDFISGLPVQSLNLIVSVGASGAIMALCGAMVAANLFKPDPLAELSRSHAIPPVKNNMNVLLQIIGLNLVSGFFIHGIDQAAHLGGAAAGFVLGTGVFLGSAASDNIPGQFRAYWKRIGLVTLATIVALGVLLYFVPWTQLNEVRSQLKQEQAQIQEQREREIAQKEQAAQEKEAEELREKGFLSGAFAVQKAATPEGKALIARLPAPVSNTIARGRVIKYHGEISQMMALSVSEDERYVDVISRYFDKFERVNLNNGKTQFLKVKDSMDVNKLTSVLSAYNRQDGLVLSANKNYPALMLLDPSKDDNVVNLWRQCTRDPEYPSNSWYPGSAYMSDEGHNWVAFIGSGYQFVRVVELETGIDLAIFPTTGDPLAVQFSRDGKRLFIMSMTEQGQRSIAIVEMDKRMDPNEALLNKHMICDWD